MKNDGMEIFCLKPGGQTEACGGADFRRFGVRQ